MTSRRDVLKRCSTDELDRLIRWTLYDSVGRARPPACVWERIEQRVQRRVTGRAVRYVLAGVWEKVKRNILRRMTSRTRRYAYGGGFYQPVGAFGVWESRVSLSLVCIVEQQTPILRLGWAV